MSVLPDASRFNQIGVVLDNQRVSIDARHPLPHEERTFNALLMIYGEIADLRAAVISLERRLDAEAVEAAERDA